MGDDERDLQSGVPLMPSDVRASVPTPPVPDEAPLAETLNSVDEHVVPAENADEQFEGVEAGPELPVVQWQASEYVHHDKTMRWYAVLLGILVLLLAVAIFTKEWLSIGVFVAMTVAVAVYARRPPRTLSYTLDDLGVHIENKSYPYEQFSSFGVLQDADWRTIDLEPTQRFMPRLSILFDEANLDDIVDRLEAELPRLDRQPDFVERITHSIKF